MEKMNIKNIFRGVFTKNKIKVRGTRNVKRDWFVLVVLFAIAMILAISFNLYMFYQVQQGKSFVLKDGQTNNIPTLDKELLENTLNIYEERSSQFEKYKSESPRTPKVN